jgi:hypothetical protein
MSEAATSHGSQAARRLIPTLTDDVRIVAEDFQRRGFKRAVGGTLSGLESFYLTEEDRRQLAAMSAWSRFWHRIWWFTKSLLMKLTPARRIMLAASLTFLLLGLQRIDFRTVHVTFRFPLVGSLLLLTVLVLELKDKLVARDELEAGRKVQLALMPGRAPDVPGWDVWLYTQPANDVGGDLVDHLRIDDQRHFVALGDVAGKALPAALLSVKLQATLRALAPNFADLGSLGDAVNFILQRDGLPTRFASLVYLQLAPDSGRIRVLNAGHMPPLAVRGPVVTVMPRGAMVLGIMPGATFFEQQIDMAPGDTLIVYSDGVSEAMNETGDFFGDERLQAVARQASALSVADAGARILEAVARFAGHTPPNDDVSLIVLRRA